jgi:hypothetical protein
MKYPYPIDNSGLPIPNVILITVFTIFVLFYTFKYGIIWSSEVKSYIKNHFRFNKKLQLDKVYYKKWMKN